MKKIYFIVAILLLDIASWLRYYFSGSIKIDQNYLVDMPMYLVTLLSFLGVGIGLFAYTNTVFRKSGFDFDLLETRKLAWLMLILATPMLPLLSNDVFSLMAYGDLWYKGYNPYTEHGHLYQTDYFNYIGDLYISVPSCYGPVVVYMLGSIAALSGGNTFIFLALLKLFYFVLGGGIVELSFRYAKKHNQPDEYNLTALVALCPVFLIEGIGQNHNDFVGFFFVLASVYFIRLERVTAAAVFITLAVLVKISYIILAPMPFLALWLMNQKNIFNTIKASIVPIVACVVLIILAYFPLYDGLASVTVPYTTANELRPSGTAADMVGELLDTFGMGSKLFHWGYLVPLSKVFAFILIGVIVWKNRNLQTISQLLEVTGKFAVIMLCFYSHRIFPWYFLLILPFFLESRNKHWLYWSCIIFPIIIMQGIAQTPTRDSILFPAIIGVTTFLTVAMFFYRLKERFIE